MQQGGMIPVSAPTVRGFNGRRWAVAQRWGPSSPAFFPITLRTGLRSGHREVGIVLPNNQRQHRTLHRTLHIQKDVLPYALC